MFTITLNVLPGANFFKIQAVALDMAQQYMVPVLFNFNDRRHIIHQDTNIDGRTNQDGIKIERVFK